MADSSFALTRAIGIWVTLIAVESIHGVMRRLFLEPQLGDLQARQVSVFTGAVLITLVFWLTLKWLGRSHDIPVARPRPISNASVNSPAKTILYGRSAAVANPCLSAAILFSHVNFPGLVSAVSAMSPPSSRQ